MQTHENTPLRTTKNINIAIHKAKNHFDNFNEELYKKYLFSKYLGYFVELQTLPKQTFGEKMRTKYRKHPQTYKFLTFINSFCLVGSKICLTFAKTFKKTKQ